MPVHRPKHKRLAYLKSLLGGYLVPSTVGAECTPEREELPFCSGVPSLCWIGAGKAGGDGAAMFHLAETWQHPQAKRTPSEKAPHPSEGNSHSVDGRLEIVSHQALMDLSSPSLSLIIPPLGRY